ncbi:hypothetical protein HY992_05720 [Candidatus Micrarchaeota archaeon]|nr:hypothetical protein [Candidatus Micrarchaeota archaeon]
MNMNVKFTGVMEKIIAEAIKQGLVKTKTEALRLGLLTLNEKYTLMETKPSKRIFK